MPTTLSDLPPELRQRIYHFAISITTVEPPHPWERSQNRITSYASLTLVSRQTYADVQAIFSNSRAVNITLTFENIPALYDAHILSNKLPILHNARFRLVQAARAPWDGGYTAPPKAIDDIDDFLCSIDGFEPRWLVYPAFETVDDVTIDGTPDTPKHPGFQYDESGMIVGQESDYSLCDVVKMRFPITGDGLELVNYTFFFAFDESCPCGFVDYLVLPHGARVLEGKLQDLVFNLGAGGRPQIDMDMARKNVAERKWD